MTKILRAGADASPRRTTRVAFEAMESMRRQLSSELGAHGVRVVTLRTGGGLRGIRPGPDHDRGHRKRELRCPDRLGDDRPPQRVPRQVIQPNRNWTGSRAQSRRAGICLKSFEFTAMWMLAG